MGLASATALSWSPLPLRLSCDGAARGGAPKCIQKFSAAGSVSCGCSRGFVVPLTFSWKRNFSQSWNVLDSSLNSGSRVDGLEGERRKKRRRQWATVMTRAGIRLDPGGGRNRGDRTSRVLVNLALAGGLTYLTLTGQLGWVLDTVLSLWLLAAILPIVGFAVFFWFANRELVRGACPNCGQKVQVLEFTMKEGPGLCPYCSQPFKLDNGQFVRDEPHFSGGFNDGFGRSGGFNKGASGSQNQDPGGAIVDIEAKVVDRD